MAGVWYIRLPGGKSGLRRPRADDGEVPEGSRSLSATSGWSRCARVSSSRMRPRPASADLVDGPEDRLRHQRTRRDGSSTRRWRHLEPTFRQRPGRSRSRRRACAPTSRPGSPRTHGPTSAERTKTQPATVQRELAMLRRAFQLGLEGRKVQPHPGVPDDRRSNNTRKGFFERDEFDRVRGRAARRLHPAALRDSGLHARASAVVNS